VPAKHQEWNSHQDLFCSEFRQLRERERERKKKEKKEGTNEKKKERRKKRECVSLLSGVAVAVDSPATNQPWWLMHGQCCRVPKL